MRGSQDTVSTKAAPSRHARSVPRIEFDPRGLREADERRMARIGWLVTIALTLVNVIVVSFVMKTHNAWCGIDVPWLQKVRAYLDAMVNGNTTNQGASGVPLGTPGGLKWGGALDEFLAEIRSVDPTNVDAIESAVHKIRANSRLWRGSHNEEELEMWLQRVSAALATLIKTRNLKEKLAGIEAHLATSPTIENLARDFAEVRGPDLMIEARDAPPDLKARFNSVADQVAQKYVEALRTAANAAASATSGEGLVPYGLLEDTIREILLEAIAHRNADAEAIYKPMWKQVYSEVNAIVSNLFNDAYQNRVEWKNLLTDTSGWTIAPSSSFKHTFGAFLTLVNVPGEQSELGGLSYWPADKWRDYVLEVELRIHSGTLAFYTRIGDKMDPKQAPAFSVGTKDSTIRIEYGKTCTLVISTIGNRLTVTGEGISHTEDIEYTKSRKGEPGIVAPAGTTATITKLRARRLR